MEPNLWLSIGTMLGATGGTFVATLLGGKKATHALTGAVAALHAEVATLRTDLDLVMEHLGLRVKGTKNGATVELGRADDVQLRAQDNERRKER